MRSRLTPREAVEQCLSEGIEKRRKILELVIQWSGVKHQAAAEAYRKVMRERSS